MVDLVRAGDQGLGEGGVVADVVDYAFVAPMRCMRGGG